MRLLRLGALFGSLILLVATTVSLIDKRAELSRDQDDRVHRTASIATDSVEATIARAIAVADTASAATTPQDVLQSFDITATACLDAGERQCSGPDLAALDAYGAASARSAELDGAAVAVVDVASDSILVVAHGEVTVVIQLRLDAILEAGALREIADLGTEVDVSAAPNRERAEPELATIDGRRTLATTITDPFPEGTQGSVAVTASIDDGVGLGGNRPGLYAVLLSLGTVLLALAGWTFFAEGRQLEQRATTDELTGLVNRREFERESEEAIEMASRFGTGLCIMLIDLNGFKQINDTRGHQFGDQVLKACADRLREAVRDTDLVGRWGGDEFVVLLPSLEESGAVRASAERIAASLSATPAAGDVTITGSIGAALYPRHGLALGDLMQAADVAMYEAKSTGVIHRLAETIPTASPLPPPDYAGPERRKTGASADEPERAGNR